jgi:molybdopterin biosynthesis enzyme
VVFNLKRLFVAESNGGIAERSGRHVAVITVVLKDGVTTNCGVACEYGGGLLPAPHENACAPDAHFELGAELAFWRVAIKPGKPLLVARRGHQVILGLPGNPAAAFVTGFLFLLPLIRAALGAGDPMPHPIPAALREAMPAGGSRMEFLRAVWDGGQVSLDGLQDSGALSSLARANALVVRPAHAPEAPAGQSVPVYLL